VRKKKPSISQVVAALELLARFHPAGFGLLLGQVNEPSPLEIADLLGSFSSSGCLGVRISGGAFVPEGDRIVGLCEIFMNIIESIGGWEHIYKTTREVKKDVHPKFWQVAVDYASHITPGGIVRNNDGGMSGRIFNTRGEGRHDICVRTARRRFRNLLRIIAHTILSFLPDDSFDLSWSTDGGYPK
jgi:hypothetical protein